MGVARMTFHLSHPTVEHHQLLSSTLAAWSRGDQDLYLISTEGHRVYTSSRLLILSSPSLSPLLSSSTAPGISLPCSSSSLSSLLSLLTTGSVTATKQVLEEVVKAANMLGVNLDLEDGDTENQERRTKTPSKNMSELASK